MIVIWQLSPSQATWIFFEIGLLQSVPSIIGDGHQIYFCYLHLSIQELLAAVHISQMSPKQQISVFQELFGTPRFSAVFQFYAGITKLRTNRPWLSKLPRFLCPVPTSVYDLVRKCSQERMETGWFKHLYLSLSSTVSMKLRILHYVCLWLIFLTTPLAFADTTLSPLDCLSVGYFLSVS